MTLRVNYLSLQGVQCLTDNSVVMSCPQIFDLSQNKLLRTLEVTAPSIDDALRAGTGPNLLTHALSTIKSPVFSEIVVVYLDYAIRGALPFINPGSPPISRVSRDKRAWDGARHRLRFGVFRKVHKVREFRLVLCADVWEGVEEYSLRILKQEVEVEKARRGFNGAFSEPLVISSPRGGCPPHAEFCDAAGMSGYPVTWTPL